MKDILLKREDELLTALGHLDEQYRWAHEHGHTDLRDAYSDGQRLLLDRIAQVQKLVALCPKEEN